MWSKLLARENVDITTISGIAEVFFGSIWEFSKTRKELFFVHFYKKSFTHYVDISSYEWGKYLYKKYFDSPESIKKYYYEGKKIKTDIIQKTKLHLATIDKNNSQKNLLSAYKNFKRQLDVINPLYSILSWLAIEFWQIDFDKVIRDIIQRHSLQNKQDKIIFSICQPWRKTAINEIQAKIQNGQEKNDLIEEYQFLRSWSLIWHKRFDKEWINDLSQADNFKIKFKKYSEEEIYKILQPKNYEKKIIKMAPYIIFFKDWRDDLRRFFCFKWLFLFHAIGDYFKIDYNDLGYLTLDEIKEILERNKINKQIISNRKNSHCIMTTKTKKLEIQVISSKSIPKRYNRAIEQSKQLENEIIKGLVGNRGKVKGQVRIVTTYDDIKRFNKGEVLVANTTHPNYLPAMQKAVAFITNEGGIVSHAAIIAREFNIPCIVGTKIATQVLKDGDMVEVDANKGVVTRLV